VCGGSAACSAPLLEAVSGATPYCGTGSGGQSGSAAAGPQQQQVQRHTSGGAGDKLSTILAYLDAVEASVQQDVGLLPSG
jgi:hypothetical protein